MVQRFEDKQNKELYIQDVWRVFDHNIIIKIIAISQNIV